MSLLVGAAACEIAAVVLSWGLEPGYDTAMYAVYAMCLASAGTAVIWRYPRHAIGWLFSGFALLSAVTSDVAQGWGLRAAEQGWSAGPAGEWVAYWSWLPSGLGWILRFLLFPDGRFPSRRWRLVAWCGVLGTLLAVPGWALAPASVSIAFRDLSSVIAPNDSDDLPGSSAMPMPALLRAGVDQLMFERGLQPSGPLLGRPAEMADQQPMGVAVHQREERCDRGGVTDPGA